MEVLEGLQIEQFYGAQVNYELTPGTKMYAAAAA